MNSIAYVDIEINPVSQNIVDIGSIKNDGNYFHNNSVTELIGFLKGIQFLCGHNIFNHDLKYIGNVIKEAGVDFSNIIDTLYLSPLLFPTKPYHALLKDDKLLTDFSNNPLNDSIKTRDLLNDEITAFLHTDEALKQIFYLLLNDKKEFQSFFKFLNFTYEAVKDIEFLIRHRFDKQICNHVDISKIISDNPIELAYCLALINSYVKYKKISSITPNWVLKSYPEVEKILFRLRNRPCVTGCDYCNDALDAHKVLKRFFGFENFRNYGGEPLQEKAVKAAINNKSLLAVFPTGGGKSVTFQLPALLSAEVSKGLTIIISPLQSLMKDQVDNLEKNGITEAVTINGLLDPIERAKSFERIEDGSASILYISPESLRSKTIERLILGRKIARFVIDEAHCFSSWGQDFRVDYLYIGDFIKAIQEKKNLSEVIPVSCFTATAKQKVIEDIREYFDTKLSINLELFTSNVSRTNLHYKVIEKNNEEEKYITARNLIEDKNCPTIIYVSRTRKANLLAERLSSDGFSARAYHGKMDKQEKSKNQEAFIDGEVQIMVATSAFGMGVDKKDVGMVIHYEISDSLENYVQEAGRAGRDENITAECFVLFDEEDLNKHFILLNQTKLSIKEIQQIWKAVKEITKFRLKISNSALEIARKAGWDDNVVEIETRVTTAIAALEEAGYLKRGQNMPRVFASSILSKNAQEAIDKIKVSEKFEDHQKDKAIRIIKKLFSSKNKKQVNEDTGESRVDYISDHLGIVKEEVINIINLLREEKIIADTQDLSAFINKGGHKNKSSHIVEIFSRIENFLLPLFEEDEKGFHLKELNEKAENQNIADININKIKTVINFWTIKNWIKYKNADSKNHIAVILLHPKEVLKQKIEKRHELAKFIIEILHEKTNEIPSESDMIKDEILIQFSIQELITAYENSSNLFKYKINISDIEDTLFFLSKIDAIKIEGGFMILYNPLTIERIEQNSKKQYTKEDYLKLYQFYENKIQQIHIVGEYAKQMLNDYKSALQFVEDYFQLNYSSFLNKYFRGSRQNEIKQNITPSKFRQLFGELSPTQLKIIKDNESRYIVVAAGPGSGKTKILVHKLASLLLMEDVKHEQLLMITFSKAAATEFKKRLLKLIGNAAYYIEIKTFHSYCFDLMGKVGSIEKSQKIIEKTIEKIKKNEVEINRITKTVLVIDEAQDMDTNEFNLINILIEKNEEMRVIAVGDDDQNIFEFRGADSKYMQGFLNLNNAVKYELTNNYRSKKNLIDFTNQFVSSISHRLKITPIVANQSDYGSIKIVRYQSANLINPIVQDIINTGLSGSTCVLTITNEEALQITGLLVKNNLSAKLIQTNDGFNLINLDEIRYFLNQLNLSNEDYLINEEIWEIAKRKLRDKFCQSNRLEICLSVINEFESTNIKVKYKSDLEIFIRESKLEDFFNVAGDIIFVSTIHKAKGKEFDNVFLLLDNYFISDDTDKRLLYVALTRAKNNLYIHKNGMVFDNLRVDNLQRINNNDQQLPPDQLTMHLSHTDINLGYCGLVQHRINLLKSGDHLIVSDEGCKNDNGEYVLKFSRKYMDFIKEQKNKNFFPDSAKVNFIVYWYNDEKEMEVKIILPEVNYRRKDLA